MFWLVGKPDQNPPLRRAHLRLLSAVNEASSVELGDELKSEVQGTRRALARLLRAFQASGRSVTQWPNDLVTRLAHLDSVTARYLIDQRASTEEVKLALRGMRAIERWANESLTADARSEVRGYELVIRIDDEGLTQPLLQPDGAPEDVTPAFGLGNAMPPRSLRVGLGRLSDTELQALARRLGLGPLPIEGSDATDTRTVLERRTVETLRDDHLLSILLATLEVEAQRLLARLVRGDVDTRELEDLAQPHWQEAAVGGDFTAGATPIDGLKACGLVFVTQSHRPSAWVPVELQPRIHGVLASFGL